MAYHKPLPKTTKEDRPFWEGVKQRRFLLPRCTQCGHTWFPPYQNCQRCLSFDREWKEASGRGHVFGFIEMQQPYIPSFKDELPYNVALIELEEGPKMYSNIVGIPNDQIRVGMAVEVVFEDANEEFAIPKFRPREE